MTIGVARCPRTGEYFRISAAGLAKTGCFSTNTQLQWEPDIATFQKFLADVAGAGLVVEQFQYKPVAPWVRVQGKELTVNNALLMDWLKADTAAKRHAAIKAALEA
jgi:D-mannonate dehydratase